MLKRFLHFFNQLGQFRAYSRVDALKSWCADREFVRFVFGETVLPEDLSVYVYQDENGLPALEVQYGSTQVLIVRHSPYGDILLVRTESMITMEPEHRDFFIPATIEAIEDINLSLPFGSVYLGLESGSYALRFMTRVPSSAFKNKEQFTLTMRTLDAFAKVNVVERYRQFINHVTQEQERQRQEFDVE